MALPDGPFSLELEPGLVIAAHDPPEIPDIGYSEPSAEGLSEDIDRRLIAVTVDPARYEIVYLSLLDPTVHLSGGATAGDWAAQHDLLVAWNPGMFEPSYEATGYTRSGELQSQGQLRANGLHRSFFVSGPRGEGLPALDVLDRKPPHRKDVRYVDPSPELRAELERWDLVSQNLPVLRDGAPAYPPRTRQWSELAYGVDDQGRLLVVFSRFPYELRELGARIAALDMGARHLVHGEGGPEASLAVRAGGLQTAWWGSYETGFSDDSNPRAWHLPAVMGVRPRRE